MLLNGPGPTHNFQLLVERMLPASSEIFPYEYHVGNLMRNNRMCLDLAFLEAAWRYSRKVGEGFFQCGDFTPPLPYVSDPGVAGEASSSSSNAKPK